MIKVKDDHYFKIKRRSLAKWGGRGSTFPKNDNILSV